MFNSRDISNDWSYESSSKEYKGKTNLPSCNYTDLLNDGFIPPPFEGENEKDLRWVAEKDWIYSRAFMVEEEVFSSQIVRLNFESIDTIADIFINDKKVACVSNAHMGYNLDIKEYIKVGENMLRVYIHSPIIYVERKQKEKSMPKHFSGISGFSYLRKPAYHFGWDWGPVLPCSGIEGRVFLVYGQEERIESIRHEQEFSKGKVALTIAVEVENANENSNINCILVSPEGQKVGECKAVPFSEKDSITTYTAVVEVSSPKRWYPNGMKGEGGIQPVYMLRAEAISGGNITHSKEVEIGFRTVSLSTTSDQYGYDFCFVVNGSRIFAKGANWIPCHSFMSSVSDERMEKYIKNIASSNFNMLRIWGGGFYGSDKLYSLCNKYGIMVWQDFQYACAPYPFDDKDFLTKAIDEATYNIKRIRNNPSLSLLCGNNEIEQMSLGWTGIFELKAKNRDFFYKTLPSLVRELSSVPYWPSSPSSGEYLSQINSDNIGDTHIWNVWHGMRPFEYFLKRKTRFCSEYGFESLPSRDTLNSFIQDEKDFTLNSSVMKAHQKCSAGNDRMLYYIINKYRIPKDFFHLAYLTQLNQAESIATAAEFWRRNMGRCNGSLYWQLNDCWPTASWSSIEFNGKYKALQYFAKDFYRGVAVSVYKKRHTAHINVVNDTLTAFEGILNWKLVSFEGETLSSKSEKIIVAPYHNYVADKLVLNSHIRVKNYDSTALVVELIDKEGRVQTRNTSLLVKERRAKLKKPVITFEVRKKDDKIIIALRTDTYARRVMLDIKDCASSLSQNFFDMEKGITYGVEMENPQNLTPEQVKNRLYIVSVGDIEPRYTRFKERLIKVKIALTPINLVNNIIRRFI